MAGEKKERFDARKLAKEFDMAREAVQEARRILHHDFHTLEAREKEFFALRTKIEETGRSSEVWRVWLSEASEGEEEK